VNLVPAFGERHPSKLLILLTCKSRLLRVPTPHEGEATTGLGPVVYPYPFAWVHCAAHASGQVSSICALRASLASKRLHAPSGPCQSPPVAAFAYSVARVSKKFACSTAFRISGSHGNGCSEMP